MEGLVIAVIIIVAVVVGIIIQRTFFMRSSCKKVGYIIVPCSANTKNLEKIVRSYYWEEVFGSELLGREILVVIMEKSENDYVAKRLAQELSIVSVTNISGLEDYLKKKEYQCNKVID